MNDCVLWSLIYKKIATNETGISNQIIFHKNNNLISYTYTNKNTWSFYPPLFPVQKYIVDNNTNVLYIKSHLIRLML